MLVVADTQEKNTKKKGRRRMLWFKERRDRNLAHLWPEKRKRS